MTMLWIGLAVLVVLLFAAWRLRRASHTVDRIIDEERTRSITDSAGDHLAEQHDESERPPSGAVAARRWPNVR